MPKHLISADLHFLGFDVFNFRDIIEAPTQDKAIEDFRTKYRHIKLRDLRSVVYKPESYTPREILYSVARESENASVITLRNLFCISELVSTKSTASSSQEWLEDHDAANPLYRGAFLEGLPKNLTTSRLKPGEKPDEQYLDGVFKIVDHEAVPVDVSDKYPGHVRKLKEDPRSKGTFG